MNDLKTSLNHSPQPEKRLFLLFLSPQQFFPSPVRSLLKYFEANSWFPLLELNPNLHNASSQLTLDYCPLIYRWLLPDGSQETITISVIPQADSTNLLCWDLGAANVAEYLVGSQAKPEVIEGLKNLLLAGLNMTSRVAALTYESEPNQELQLSIVDYINFSLSRLPIILGSRFGLTPQLTCLADDERALLSTEDNPVFVVNPLPLNLEEICCYSVWADETGANYYRLPTSLVSPVADFSLRNCLSSQVKRVDRQDIEQYALAQGQAQDYLADELEQSVASAMAYLNDWITDQATTVNLNPSPKVGFTGSEADWAQIIGECLEVTESQIAQNPQLIEERVKELLIQFHNLIADDESVSTEARESAQKTAVKLQNILTSHGFKLDNTLEQLTANVRKLNALGRSGQNSEQSERLRRTLAFLSERNTNDNTLEAIITVMTNAYEELRGDKPQPPDYVESARNTVQKVTEKYPLPSLSFDDLFKD